MVFAEDVSFAAFCNLCEHLLKLRKVEAKKQKLFAFVDEWRSKDAEHLYDLFRLLLPHLDDGRTNYGMKEAKLAELYISVLAIPPTSTDSNRLRSWEQSSHVDFAQVLESVLQSRMDGPSGGKGASLASINCFLDELSTISTGIEAKRDLFLKKIAHMSAREQKWLARIMLKSLRLGMPDNQVMRLIHPDAPSLYDVRMNLREVIEALHSATPGTPIRFGIKLFRPFRPMLAERTSPQALTLHLQQMLVETKLDGERIQLHYLKAVDQPQFRYWSRQGTEYTFLYGRSPSEGSLTPTIFKQHGVPENVESAVFDGEMVTFDSVSGKILPFGTLKTAAASATESSKTHPCFIAFDLVYLNGESLLDMPLNERRKHLLESVNPIPGYFQVIESKMAASMQQVQAALDEAIESQSEGLVVKDPLSTYRPGHRLPEWTKIKPEYVDGLCDDLDVVIIGAWYCRSSSIQAAYGHPNTYLCGVWTDDRRQVIPFTKIGGGFNLTEWMQLAQKLDGHWLPLQGTFYDAHGIRIPPGTAATDRPDAIIDDIHNSLVIQIKGSQLVPAEKYAGTPFVLRHPRFVRLRPDRSPDSSMTLGEVIKLNQVTQGTLAKRGAMKLDQSPLKPSAKKGKWAEAIQEAQQRQAHLQAVPSQDSAFLADYEILVMAGPEVPDKQDLEAKIVAAGAIVVQCPSTNLGERQFIIVCGRDGGGLRLRHLKNTNQFDIVSVQWALDCLAAKDALNPFQPQYIVQLTEKTRSSIATNTD